MNKIILTNMKNKLVGFVIIIFTQLAVGQTKFYVNYTWEKNPVLTINTDKITNDFYVVKEKHVFEYAYDSNNQLSFFETKHVLTHVNNDKGVEVKNKMYIPSGKIIEMIDLKARCITSSGKIINLDKSSIKEVDNLENQGPFTIFAFEGVEPNSDIEYMYTAKKTVSLYGSFNTQFSFIQKNVEIDFISPKNLIFDLKTYNGFPSFIKDTSDQKINHSFIKAAKIEEFEAEKYSADEANKQRFDFILRYNTVKSDSKYYTWNIIGNELITAYYSNTKDDIKAIQKAIDKSGASKKNTDNEKISEFESYIKNNIIFSTDAPNTLTIEKTFQQKLTNAFNLNKIFIEASKQLGLNIEMVFTNNRFESEFDQNFEGYNQLDELLIYYPSIGKYICPANYYSRIGFPPEQYTLNKGLFVKPTEVAGITAGIAKIKYITSSDYLLSQNTIDAKISFEGDNLIPKTQIQHSFTGYSAYNIQPLYHVLNDIQKKETAEDILKQINENTIVKNYKVENGEPEDILKKPFIISGNIETPMLMENAGNKFLYKVGIVIGPQSELYQDKSRQTDIVLSYAHGFVRNLDITIPEGYKISNLNDLNFNVVLKENDKETAYFKSHYTLNEKKLSINISEQYINTFFTKDKYKEFKDVINAAADFNKVTLIFEKI